MNLEFLLSCWHIARSGVYFSERKSQESGKRSTAASIDGATIEQRSSDDQVAMERKNQAATERRSSSDGMKIKQRRSGNGVVIDR